LVLRCEVIVTVNLLLMKYEDEILHWRLAATEVEPLTRSRKA